MSTEIQEPSAASAKEESKKIMRRFDWRIGILVLLAASPIPIYRAVRVAAKADAVTSKPFPVAVAKVMRENPAQELVLDAELRCGHLHGGQRHRNVRPP